MKKIIIAMLLLVGTQVHGTVINFADNAIYWPGWESSTSDSNRDLYRNTHDVIGTPDITGGAVTLNNGYLTSVVFNVMSIRGDDWPQIKPADLFIDMNNDKTWDYVVNMITETGAGDRGLYAVSQPLNNPDYITAYIPGVNPLMIRAGHPIGVDVSGSPIDIVGFTGWPDSLASGSATTVSFDLGQGVPIGQSFTIGWGLNCANDVVYQPINVPEASSIVFLMLGLIGVVGVGYVFRS
jgi:hypothetical protein